jgi:hypothetical protein
VFVPEFSGFEFFFVGADVNFFENIFESAVILFQNGVFGTHKKRVVSFQSVFETGVGEFLN